MSISHPTIIPLHALEADESARAASQLAQALAEVSQVIASVWPLNDYVAVNPYAGIADKSFVDAREFLRLFSDCETLMPIAYYAGEYRDGRLSPSDIEKAIEELEAVGCTTTSTPAQIVQHLEAFDPSSMRHDPRTTSLKHP